MIIRYLINTPLVIKSDDICEMYKAFIIYYTVEITPLTVGLEINNIQTTAF